MDGKLRGHNGGSGSGGRSSDVRGLMVAAAAVVMVAAAVVMTAAAVVVRKRG